MDVRIDVVQRQRLDADARTVLHVELTEVTMDDNKSERTDVSVLACDRLSAHGLRRRVLSTDDLSDELSLLFELSVERPHFIDAIERRGRDGGKGGSGSISSLCSQ